MLISFHQSMDMLLQKLTLHELLYLADNLATFPYVNQDEPLYVIHQADQVVSLTGAHLMQVRVYKSLLLLFDTCTCLGI